MTTKQELILFISKFVGALAFVSVACFALTPAIPSDPGWGGWIAPLLVLLICGWTGALTGMRLIERSGHVGPRE